MHHPSMIQTQLSSPSLSAQSIIVNHQFGPKFERALHPSPQTHTHTNDKSSIFILFDFARSKLCAERSGTHLEGVLSRNEEYSSSFFLVTHTRVSLPLLLSALALCLLLPQYVTSNPSTNTHPSSDILTFQTSERGHRSRFPRNQGARSASNGSAEHRLEQVPKKAFFRNGFNSIFQPFLSRDKTLVSIPRCCLLRPMFYRLFSPYPSSSLFSFSFLFPPSSSTFFFLAFSFEQRNSLQRAECVDTWPRQLLASPYIRRFVFVKKMMMLGI